MENIILNILQKNFSGHTNIYKALSEIEENTISTIDINDFINDEINKIKTTEMYARVGMKFEIYKFMNFFKNKNHKL